MDLIDRSTALLSQLCIDLVVVSDLQPCGTIASPVWYYRLSGTTAPQERYYRVRHNTKILLRHLDMVLPCLPGAVLLWLGAALKF